MVTSKHFVLRLEFKHNGMSSINTYSNNTEMVIKVLFIHQLMH